jgi:hypothetical protein
VPLGEFQTANQVADVVGFLCSTAGDYITGTVLLQMVAAHSFNLIQISTQSNVSK